MNQRRSQFEFRCYAGFDLYQRVLREAAARRISLSQCVRTDLGQYYAIRDELTGAVQVEEAGSGSDLGRRIMHTLLAEMETRLVATLDRQGAVFQESLNVVAWMLDEALITILSAFPDERAVYRERVGILQRHEGWRAKAVERIAAAEPRWPSSRQISRRSGPPE
jgi:hypothetical protein